MSSRKTNPTRPKKARLADSRRREEEAHRHDDDSQDPSSSVPVSERAKAIAERTRQCMLERQLQQLQREAEQQQPPQGDEQQQQRPPSWNGHLTLRHMAMYHDDGGDMLTTHRQVAEALDAEAAKRKKLECELSVEKSRRQALEEQLKIEQGLRQQLQQQVATMQAEHARELQSMRDSHDNELSRAASKHNRLEDEIERLKRLISEKDRIIADLRAEVASLKQDNAILCTRIAALEQQVQSHDTQMQTMRQSHDTQMQAMRRAHDDQLAAAHKQTALLNARHVVAMFLDELACCLTERWDRDTHGDPPHIGHWGDMANIKRTWKRQGNYDRIQLIQTLEKSVASDVFGIGARDFRRLHDFKKHANASAHPPDLDYDKAIQCIDACEIDGTLKALLRRLCDAITWYVD